MLTRMFHIALLVAVFATAAFSQGSLINPAGVYRFQGLGGKCLDVGGYPLGRSSPAILYSCNGTTAQDMTLVPFRSPIDSTVEIHAQGRCLGVSANPEVFAPPMFGSQEAAFTIGFPLNPPAAGWQVILEPCDGTTSQRFYAPDRGRIYPKDNINLAVTAEGGSSADHTRMILEPLSNLPGQLWNMLQYDTTNYDFPAPRETTGSYVFRGFASKCIDVGGWTPPDHSPVFLYGCNGSIAQDFSLQSANDHLQFYTIRAFGKCFEVAGNNLAAGSPIQINTCSGSTSQQFAFDHYDWNYIYPVGRPDVVIGVQGANSANRTPLALQQRSRVDFQNWQPIASDQPTVGPMAPDVSFDAPLTNTTVPTVKVRLNSTLNPSLEILWRFIGQDTYSTIAVPDIPTNPEQVNSIALPSPKILGGQEFYVKARSTTSKGLFSDSPEILVDSRQLPSPVLSVRDVQSEEATVTWQSAGTPLASTFLISFTAPSNGQSNVSTTALDGNGLNNKQYSQHITGLQPNTKYRVDVEAHRNLWSGSYSETYVTTLPAVVSGPTPIVTSIFMNRTETTGGNIPYGGVFGPVYQGAVITNINFPAMYPAVWLVRRGYSTDYCGDLTASVLLQGDMTAAQKKFIWGTSNLSISGQQQLDFVGCSASTGVTPNWLPVNITWSQP